VTPGWRRLLILGTATGAALVVSAWRVFTIYGNLAGTAGHGKWPWLAGGWCLLVFAGCLGGGLLLDRFLSRRD
jgi:hypothetical protein